MFKDFVYLFWRAGGSTRSAHAWSAHACALDAGVPPHPRPHCRHTALYGAPAAPAPPPTLLGLDQKQSSCWGCLLSARPRKLLALSASGPVRQCVGRTQPGSRAGIPSELPSPHGQNNYKPQRLQVQRCHMESCSVPKRHSGDPKCYMQHASHSASEGAPPRPLMGLPHRHWLWGSFLWGGCRIVRLSTK